MIHSIRTPLVSYECLPNGNLYLKCENNQPGGSYKIRGVEKYLNALPANTQSVQVISAGNMARTLAILCRERGIQVEAFVPDSIPEIKKNFLENIGVTLYPMAMEKLWEQVENPKLNGNYFLHPVDSKEMLEGYATLADEILSQNNQTTEVVLPFGVGGLTLGMARQIKKRASKIRIVVAERSELAPLALAIQNGESTYIKYKKSWVDAIGTPRILPRVLDEILKNKLIDEIRLVDSDSAMSCAKELYLNNGILIEGAAAIALAAARGQFNLCIRMSEREIEYKTQVVCILSGGNISPETLSTRSSKQLHI